MMENEPTTVMDVLLSSASVSSASSLSSSSLSASASADYIQHLTTLTLPTLLAEPPALSTQSHHLTSSLTSLTHSSYPTFLSLHSTTKSLSSSLSALSLSLTSVLTESLPALQASAAAFKAHTDPVLAERARARQVLDQHDKLRDLLDVPILIDTSVRNGYFSEALSLAAHVSSLSSSFPPPPPPILQSIQDEVTLSLRSLLRTLLHTLGEPNRKLPALWKAVTFLRRMAVMDEEEIALAFLIGRGDCLDAALGALHLGGEGEENEENKARYLRRYVDVWREGVHDLVTQYASIFLPPQPPATSSPQSTLHALLTTHTHHLLTTHLLPTLHQHLPHVPTSTYTSLLAQLTYCATSFSRLGLDFRPVVGAAVADAVRHKIIGMLRAAGDEFGRKVGDAIDSAILPSQWLVLPSCVDNPPVPPPPPTTPRPPNVPPQILTSYPPLAEFTNSLIEVLNVLRQLAPLAIAGEIQAGLEGVLDEAGGRLLVYLRQGEAGEAEREKEERIAKAVGRVWVGVLGPWVGRALGEGVYGVEVLEGQGYGEWREWEAWLGEVPQ
jgi:conserved oligomeric Golgi complex subunit 8